MELSSVMRELSAEECWKLLEDREIGRLAYHLAGEVHIVPINYACDSRESLVFRTSEGNKLLGMHMDSSVAFEVDDIRDDSATSVVLRGSAEEVPPSQTTLADDLGLKPWIPTDKFNVIRIVVKELTGRRYLYEPTDAD